MKTRKRASTQRSKLKVGAWYQMYLNGTTPHKTVCVIAIEGDKLTLECPDHLFSAAVTMDADELFIGPSYFSEVLKRPVRLKNFYSPKFLGYGKPRWFWGRVRRWTDCFGTLYTKP